MILVCKENIKSIKMFGKDIQVVNNLLLESGMIMFFILLVRQML